MNIFRIKLKVLLLVITLVLGSLCFYIVKNKASYLQKIIDGKALAEYSSTQLLPNALRSGKIKSSLEKGTIFKEDEQKWKKFHFSNFLIDLPFNNFLFDVYCEITNENPLYFQFRVLNRSGEELLSFEFLEELRLKKKVKGSYLLELPIVQEYNLARDPQKLWMDLFSTDLTLKEATWNEFTYKLLLSYMRNKFLPKSFSSMWFLEKSEIGVVESNELQGKKIEIIHYYHNQNIYRFKLTSIDSPQAKAVRYNLLNNLKFAAKDFKLASLIYKEFQGLSFKEKSSGSGLLYILSAWSQDSLNAEYLKLAIETLERRAGNEKFLEHFYDYAYSKYGTNFSTIPSKLKRTHNKKLEENLLNEHKSSSKNRAEVDQNASGNPSQNEDKANTKLYLD